MGMRATDKRFVVPNALVQRVNNDVDLNSIPTEDSNLSSVDLISHH